MCDGYRNRIHIRSHTDSRKPAAENEERNGICDSPPHSTIMGLGYSCVTITPSDVYMYMYSSYR